MGRDHLATDINVLDYFIWDYITALVKHSTKHEIRKEI